MGWFNSCFSTSKYQSDSSWLSPLAREPNRIPQFQGRWLQQHFLPSAGWHVNGGKAGYSYYAVFSTSLTRTDRCYCQSISWEEYCSYVLFQFHYGAIKGKHFGSIFAGPLDFNSTMVRLRDVKRGMASGAGLWFQFHYGAIKGKGTRLMPRLPVYISIPLWCD